MNLPTPLRPLAHRDFRVYWAGRLQQRVPNEIRGRVMAIFMMGMMLVMPLASLRLAALADLVGIDRLLVACGVAFGITTTLLALTLPRETAAAAREASTNA
jgi:hypothetical protein